MTDKQIEDCKLLIRELKRVESDLELFKELEHEKDIIGMLRMLFDLEPADYDQFSRDVKNKIQDKLQDSIKNIEKRLKEL